MYSRQPIQKKTRSQFSSTSKENNWFQPQRSTHEADPTLQPQNHETPDLQTQMETAARFGHNFGRVSVQDSSPGVIQPKLAIGAPGDKYEQEADSVAAQVMSMNTLASQQPIQRQGTESEEEEVQMKPLASMITPLVQRQEAPEEELQMKPLVQRQEAPEEELQMKPLVQRQEAPEEELQMKPLVQRQEAPEEEELQAKPLVQRQEAPEEEELQTKPLVQRQEAPEEEELQMKRSHQEPEASRNDPSGNLENQLNSSKGGGSPLPDDVRSFMEPRFGADFSQVRVHTDTQAVQMNQAVGAQAFTHGSDIYFGAGKSPSVSDLTAHELTHVVQQTGGVQRQQKEITGNAIPGIYRQQRPGSNNSTSQNNTTTQNDTNNQNGGSGPGAEPTWREMGNLLGKPPVRSETNPPNKNIVEDEAVYNQRRQGAEASLGTQKARAESLVTKNFLGQECVRDYRYWFAKVYSYVTENELKFAASNTFYYPSYVMASVLYFDKIYEDNFKAFDDGKKVEEHWLSAFKEARSRQDSTWQQAVMTVGGALAAGAATSGAGMIPGGILGWAGGRVNDVVVSLTAAMKAHIRYDLPRAEAWVFNNYYSHFPEAKLDNFRTDFMSMSGVFDNAAQEMNGDMVKKLGIPDSVMTQLMPQLVQDASMRLWFNADMATERADTWQRAEELVSSGKPANDPYRLENGKLEGDVTQSDNLSGLNNLPTKSLRPETDKPAEMYHDDEVRSMTRAQITAAPTTQKIRMIRGLFSGYTGGDDERTILTILDVSRGTGDLVTVIDGADAWDLTYATDGKEYGQLRNIFFNEYYDKTAQNTALRLIRKCMDGETANWEEQMVVDILEKHPDRRSIVNQIGKHYEGPASGSDADFKNGLYKLEWQLDGARQDKLHELFGSSGFGWWNF